MVAPYPGYGPQGSAGPQPDPVFQVTLTKVTSAFVITMREPAVYTGTLQQLESRARSVLTHNLLLGWWGFPWGPIWTSMALSRNSGAIRQVRKLAAQGPQMEGPPMQGQPWSGPPAPGQPWPGWPGQPAPGQPWPGPPAQGQPWPAPPAQGQPWQRQPPQR